MEKILDDIDQKALQSLKDAGINVRVEESIWRKKMQDIGLVAKS